MADEEEPMSPEGENPEDQPTGGDEPFPEEGNLEGADPEEEGGSPGGEGSLGENAAEGENLDGDGPPDEVPAGDEADAEAGDGGANVDYGEGMEGREDGDEGGSATERAGLANFDHGDGELTTEEYEAMMAERRNLEDDDYGTGRPASGDSFTRGLAGYSKTSMDAAFEIEGFDDDFTLGTDDVYGIAARNSARAGGSTSMLDEVLNSARGTADGGGQAFSDEESEEGAPDIDALLQDANEERERLYAINSALQKKLCQVFSGQHKLAHASGDLQKPTSTEGQEQRYQQALAQWSKCEDELDAIRRNYDSLVKDMRQRLDERRSKADSIRSAFLSFKCEVARSAENSRTGKPIPEKLIQQMEAAERKKDAEVERVRLKNIHLRNAMRKLEASMKQKEELAEGLHLIDFEQLKIENQSLNEKIEERNEELVKLRKKTTMTVQVLTHLKEKLQFMQKENEAAKKVLEALEVDLAARRDELQQLKQERDALRVLNERTKAASGVVTHAGLLADIEAQKKKKEMLEDKIETVEKQHSHLTHRLGTLRRSIHSPTGSPRRQASGLLAPLSPMAQLSLRDFSGAG
eukprot:jgi/Mesvir1/15203/Mv06437-RA.1